jgi:predicted AlkP superfamily phosphohydrolase/phosphomutase
MEHAAIGTLESTPVPNSAQAWSSFMTGLNPGKHGLYYFLKREKDSYKLELTNAMGRDGKTFWKIAGESGKKCIIVNVPMTYPPERVNGILISGMDAPGVKSGFTYPRGIYEELAREVGEYVIESDASKLFRNGNYLGALEALEQMVDKRYRAVRYLMDKYPWDLFVVVFTATDRVQHDFWRFMDETDLKNGILRIYQKMDAVIGDLRKRLDEDTTLVVMSDHGAGPNGNKTLYINKWLHSLGLLHYKSDNIGNPIKRFGHKIRSAWLWRLYLILKEILPRGTKDLFRRHTPGMYGKVRTFGHSSAIDWSKTMAYSTETAPNIWLNVKGEYPSGIVEPGEEYENIRNFIISQLEELRDPDDDKKIVGEIYRREEVYHGKHLEEAPDIIFQLNGYTHRFSQSAPGAKPIQRLSAKDLEFAESVSGRASGAHAPNGIIFMEGRNIKKAWQIKEAGIADLTPTISYVLGIPIPLYMDGRVIAEAFDDVFLRDNRPIYANDGEDVASEEEFSYSDEEKATIEERLRGLGYME